MASRGLVRIKAIREMLGACAEGFDWKEKPHHHWVAYRGKTYRALPKGGHGRGEEGEIQIGHLKKMIRFLGIEEDCAKRYLPILG